MDKRTINSKKLHLHAVPIVVTLLALTFLMGGAYALSGDTGAYHVLGRALFHRSVSLTTKSDGTLHIGLAQATPAYTPPVNTAPQIVTPQVGAAAVWQQTVDQVVSNSSY
jgi:hypothetical protein